MATYTVVKGDCLWGIARRFLGDGTRWTQLADKNGISKTNPIIYPGQVINLDVNGTSAPKLLPHLQHLLSRLCNISAYRLEQIERYLQPGNGVEQIQTVIAFGGSMQLANGDMVSR